MINNIYKVNKNIIPSVTTVIPWKSNVEVDDYVLKRSDNCFYTLDGKHVLIPFYKGGSFVPMPSDLLEVRKCVSKVSDEEAKLVNAQLNNPKIFVITAGGTSERIDTVRKITNSSSGKLGKNIAEKILQSNVNCKIFYIHAKGAVVPNDDKRVIPISIFDTNDLKETIEKVLTENKVDVFIHSMAVSDYTTKCVLDFTKLKGNLIKTIEESMNGDVDGDSEQIFENILNECVIDTSTKMSSKNAEPAILLKETPKIISLIKNLSPETFLVGFKLLTGVSEGHLVDVAHNLLVKNNCDLVLANDLNYIKQGKHIGLLVKQDKSYDKYEGKDKISDALISEIYNKIYLN